MPNHTVSPYSRLRRTFAVLTAVAVFTAWIGGAAVEPTRATWSASQTATVNTPLTAATVNKPADLHCSFTNGLLGVSRITLTWKDNGVPNTTYRIGTKNGETFTPLSVQPVREGENWKAEFTGGLLTDLLGLLLGNAVDLHIRPEIGAWWGPTSVAKVRVSGVVGSLLGSVQSCLTE